MIENLIFYFICFFFALIGLGVIWTKRESYTKLFIILFMGIPFAFIIISYAGNIHTMSLLDIRELLSYVSKDNNQLTGRGRMLMVTLIIFSIIVFLTVTINLLLQLKNRITRQFN